MDICHFINSFSMKLFCFEKKVTSFLSQTFIKDTHVEKTPSNKTPALTESTNMSIWVVGRTNQLFIRGS